MPLRADERHWRLFLEWCRKAACRGNKLQDAYLAALGIEHGCICISTDRDFADSPPSCGVIHWTAHDAENGGKSHVALQRPAPMAKEQTLNQHQFDALLAWLDSDHKRAAAKYEMIRSRLIRIFMSQGSNLAEELADRTFDRVAAKLHEISASFAGDPALYFYGVGKNILLESMRAQKPLPYDPWPKAQEENSAEYDCLEKCMKEMAPEQQKLILDYYRYTGHAKIKLRKQLAADLGIDMNMLRVRMNRIRARLRNCVRKCVERGGRSVQ